MSPPQENPPSASRNVKLVVAYDGTRYHGWQRQADGVDTVQGRLEAAVAAVVGHPAPVPGAGRTDAGVHALGQVANFHTANLAIPLGNLRQAVNARLPADIAVLSAGCVPAAFHASISATGKTYRYRIFVGPTRAVALANHVYRYGRWLELGAMAAAAGRLVGVHDFRGFASSADRRENTVRSVTRCTVTEQENEVCVSVSGSGFLYRMVRNIVGTLVEIGRGRWPVERIDQVLSSGDRTQAGPSAPASGLYLVHVDYPPDLAGAETPLPSGP